MRQSASFSSDLLELGEGEDRVAFTSRYRAGAWFREGVEPNRWFDSHWYALHNPDWHWCASPFDHFLRVGVRERRDPTWLVDFGTYSKGVARSKLLRCYASLVSGEASSNPITQRWNGVYSGVGELRSIQSEFLAATRPEVLRRTPSKRKNLVLVQHSSSHRILEWVAHPNRSFDVLANHYDDADVLSGAMADVQVVQRGTKFTAVATLFDRHPDLLSGYDHVALLDDDIAISGPALDRMFDECGLLGAALAQPGLDAMSECSWPHLFASFRAGEAVPLNTVEVMMPVFAGAFLERERHSFSKSVSGFGLDLWWGGLLRRPDEQAWRLGSVTVRHERAVDRSDGAYYQFLRSQRVNPRAELWSLVREHGLRRSIGAWPTAYSESTLNPN